MVTLLQERDEFEQFCKLMKSENVRSYLEIGSWTGKSIQLAATVLPKGSRIVSVDKPFKETKGIALRKVMEDLRLAGYDTHLIVGDSTDPTNVSKARALGPFDIVFIDGNHTTPYVTSDWENYGIMGRLVAFHDITRDIPGPIPGDDYNRACQVASFWSKLKNNYKHVEFISERTRARTDVAYGIGVIFNI
jgi:predicted O-methyltransferase YrrM